MHPRYTGQSSTDQEVQNAMELAATQHEVIVPDVINMKAQSSPFLTYMFADNVIKAVKPVDWSVSHADRVHPVTVSVAKRSLTATSPSDGIDSVFSSFGFVHSTRLRNQLGVAKAGKLAFLFKVLNRKPLDADEDCDINTDYWMSVCLLCTWKWTMDILRPTYLVTIIFLWPQKASPLYFTTVIYFLIGRLLWVDLIKWVSNVHPPIRTYVHTSIRPQKFSSNFNKIWYVGRGRRVMHDGMQYDPILCPRSTFAHATLISTF